MFAKPYKLKSNNTLKNSEKKHLAQRIQNEFPAATEDKIKELVPVKSNSTYMKLILHSEETVGVYVVDGVPMILDLGESLAPTVCALWKVPDLVPTIIIHSPVLSKMQGGAPLYVPGVVTDSISQFPKGSVISACTTDNAAAGVVGIAAMSSADLLSSSVGVCLDTLHVFGDLLCKDLKFNKLEQPKLGPPKHIIETITTDINKLKIEPVREEWPSLVKHQPTPVPNEPKVIDKIEPQDVEVDVEMENLNDTVASDNPETDAIPEDMDGLLRWCLLSFLKVEGKNIELPLKTNLLYKNHLMPYCPQDRTVDVKKSTYKKMGKFLEAMEKEGLIQVREVEKGVSALTAVSLAHPAVRAHRPPPPPAPPARPAPAAVDDDYAPPQIRELYCVTAHVLLLFAPLKKGAALSASEVRAALTRHVQAHALSEGRAVRLDAVLATALGRQPGEQLKWEEVTNGVLSRMTPSTELRFADGSTRLLKSRLDPVTFHVVTRSGNKKVTLVSNLESYGFALAPLARACQLRAGASCGVTRSAAARADQLMLQGDQTHFMAKLLIEKFGLPKKFVEGADKALNKKK